MTAVRKTHLKIQVFFSTQINSFFAEANMATLRVLGLCPQPFFTSLNREPQLASLTKKHQ